jgi:hypothetical protein
MSAIVFAGPSLPPSVAAKRAELKWHPPARHGDIYTAALLRPAIIGLIDGYFEVVPTVWHKEILWAMTQGIHVYGASSIGALRATELREFGMVGVGLIYESFRSGDLTDDDEVAVLHGPAELDYVQLTVPMVDVRATLTQAERAGVLDRFSASALEVIAKRIFYKHRTYDLIVTQARREGILEHILANFSAWLPRGCVDQKRLDALALIDAVLDHLNRGVDPLKVHFELARTFVWEAARQRLDRAAGPQAVKERRQAPYGGRK